MLADKRRIVISAVFCFIGILVCGWYFNYALAAPVLSVECMLYSLGTSFVITSFSFLFIVKPLNLKKVFFKKYFAAALLLVYIVQLVLYKPILLIMLIAL